MEDTFGLFPDLLNTSNIEKETLLHQRYSRKGIYGNLSESATDYEKALAICADDVIFRSFQEFKYRVQGGDRAKKEIVGNTIKRMQDDLNLILGRRATMTRVEAERHGFQDAVSQTIQHYSDKLWKDDNADFLLVFRLHNALQEILTPWFAVKPFISLGSVSWKWALAKPGSRFEKPHVGVALDSLAAFTQMGRIWFVELKLESIRSRIIRGEDLQDDELQFARCFRRYLETALDSEMPVLAIGTRERRDVTFTEFFKTTALRCSPGCNCALDKQKEQRALIAVKRRSNDPNMVKERQTIEAWFKRMEKLKSSPEDRRLTPSIQRVA